jgi:hypothetical protein
VAGTRAPLAGRQWWRREVIAAVAVNGIGQFARSPAHPLRGLVAIGVGVAVLHALTAGWARVRADLRRAPPG